MFSKCPKIHIVYFLYFTMHQHTLSTLKKVVLVNATFKLEVEQHIRIRLCIGEDYYIIVTTLTQLHYASPVGNFIEATISNIFPFFFYVTRSLCET